MGHRWEVVARCVGGQVGRWEGAGWWQVAGHVGGGKQSEKRFLLSTLLAETTSITI